MNMLLQDTFTTLALQYTGESALVQQCWELLQKNYSHKKRHYHNLQHIQEVLEHIQQVQSFIDNYPAVLFAVFYHDAIYNVLKQNNELKSASLAVGQLAEMGVPVDTQQQCHQLIIATQHHADSTNEDCNYFTDADLAILGCPLEKYQHYAAAIRKEYSLYPDMLYNPGRKKVMQHFLQMSHIFKTAFFQERYEQQARVNIEWELHQGLG